MQKESKVTGIFINTKSQHITKITIDNNLAAFYELLNCNCIDIVTRRFSNNKKYDIICDDLGALKANKIPAIVQLFDHKITENIYGNVLIFTHDKDGNTISIPDNEIKELLSNTYEVQDTTTNRNYIVLKTKLGIILRKEWL